MRILVVTIAALTVLILSAPSRADRWHAAVASAYSTADSPGTQACTGKPLNDGALTFASRIVPCGARVRFCVAAHRCVVATRTDSGPYVSGRSFDLSLAVVRALGFPTVRDFGVRTVRWTRVR